MRRPKLAILILVCVLVVVAASFLHLKHWTAFTFPQGNAGPPVKTLHFTLEGCKAAVMHRAGLIGFCGYNCSGEGVSCEQPVIPVKW